MTKPFDSFIRSFVGLYASLVECYSNHIIARSAAPVCVLIVIEVLMAVVQSI